MLARCLVLLAALSWLIAPGVTANEVADPSVGLADSQIDEWSSVSEIIADPIPTEDDHAIQAGCDFDRTEQLSACQPAALQPTPAPMVANAANWNADPLLSPTLLPTMARPKQPSAAVPQALPTPTLTPTAVRAHPTAHVIQSVSPPATATTSATPRVGALQASPPGCLAPCSTLVPPTLVPTGPVTPRLVQPPTCSPRPPVSLHVDPSGLVTVTANSTAQDPNNQLQSIRFLSGTNTSISLSDGPAGALGNFTVFYPAGTQQVSFTLHALTPASAVTMSFVVADSCGDWPTFAGGGPNTLPTASASPSPITTPFVPPAEPGPGTSVFRLFSKPFANDVTTSNVMDHNIPLEFEDNDTPGQELAFWGRLTPGYDSHEGYDWLTPEGTPLLAVADGQVSFAGEGGSFFCPPLGRNVTGLYLYIRHGNQQIALESRYVHLSRVDVATGVMVKEGQVLGLSGNTGCSTGPHLHFAVYRQVGTRWTPIDPYGWSGSTSDPWATDPRGAESVWLWKRGLAPRLFHPWSW